jgi:hypothetical protein
MGAERVLLMAMDELDYALLDQRVGGSASSRLFLNLLVPINSDPKTLAGEWSKVREGEREGRREGDVALPTHSLIYPFN